MTSHDTDRLSSLVGGCFEALLLFMARGIPVVNTDTLTVTGTACVRGAVTRDDEAIGTTAIAGFATSANTIFIGGATTSSCAITLGDEATDTVTVSG